MSMHGNYMNHILTNIQILSRIWRKISSAFINMAVQNQLVTIFLFRKSKYIRHFIHTMIELYIFFFIIYTRDQWVLSGVLSSVKKCAILSVNTTLKTESRRVILGRKN